MIQRDIKEAVKRLASKLSYLPQVRKGYGMHVYTSLLTCHTTENVHKTWAALQKTADVRHWFNK
jgi:hypothetical protein